MIDRRRMSPTLRRPTRVALTVIAAVYGAAILAAVLILAGRL